jgi:putative hydrolase of the HAD superfamily
VQATGLVIAAWFEAETQHFAVWQEGLIGFDEQRRRRLRDFLPEIGLRIRLHTPVIMCTT